MLLSWFLFCVSCVASRCASAPPFYSRRLFLSLAPRVRGRPLGLLAPALRPRRRAHRLSAFYKVPVRRAVGLREDDSAPWLSSPREVTVQRCAAKKGLRVHP